MKRERQRGHTTQYLGTLPTHTLRTALVFTVVLQAGPGLASETLPAPEAPAAITVPTTAGAPPSPTGLGPEQIRAAQVRAHEHRAALLQPAAAVTDPETRRALLERWGVELLGVRLAAQGYMIDFRFRVLDAEKALPLFDSKIQPYLLREGSDIKLPVPIGQRVGAFRTTNRGKNITADKTYYMMFANPDAFVKPGNRVSVVIGDFRVDGLTLQ